MKLKLHSAVDVITNSSTVIYTEATKETVSIIKQLLQCYLKQYGIDDAVENWFDIQLGPFLDEYDLKEKRIAYWDKHNEHDEPFNYDELYAELEENNPAWWNDIKKIMGRYSKSEYQDWVYINPKTQNEQVNAIADLIYNLLGTIDTKEVSC